MRTLRSRRVLIPLGVLLVTLVTLWAAVAVLAVRVSGQSMQPTLHDGDRILLRPFSGGDTPGRFALVVARFAEHGPQVLKRVIALPGDQVEIVPGEAVRVQPGGQGPWFVVQNPAWAAGGPTGTACCTAEGWSAPGAGPAQVPAGTVFLLGDDPAVSSDSRQEGWVPISQIRGRVWLRVHPPSRWGTPGDGVRLVPTI